MVALNRTDQLLCFSSTHGWWVEIPAGFAGVANERGDRITAREYAADDLAADAAGGADHCGGHRVSFR